MRVVVAMSGGVDSSTTAALLVEAGHEVIGLAMQTHTAHPGKNRACCTPEDMRAAREVADLLDIPLHVLDYRELFHEQVIKPFALSYRQGLTPNPCVTCNDKVKFYTLLQHAQRLGAEKLATGHYSQIGQKFGNKLIVRGEDREKDQSYFLYKLTPAQLEHVWFPVGHLHKRDVRAQARRFHLPLADKPESQEICFVGAGGYGQVVEEVTGKMPGGDIVDEQGKVLGRHEGIHRYTVGQRRGLKIAHSEPLYVTSVDAQNQLVKVGNKQALQHQSVVLREVIWHIPPPRPTRLLLQTRYRATPCSVELFEQPDNTLHARFAETLEIGAPGQAAVLYDEDYVVGGGVVAHAYG